MGGTTSSPKEPQPGLDDPNSERIARHEIWVRDAARQNRKRTQFVLNLNPMAFRRASNPQIETKTVSESDQLPTDNANHEPEDVNCVVDLSDHNGGGLISDSDADAKVINFNESGDMIEGEHNGFHTPPKLNFLQLAKDCPQSGDATRLDLSAIVMSCRGSVINDLNISLPAAAFDESESPLAKPTKVVKTKTGNEEEMLDQDPEPLNHEEVYMTIDEDLINPEEEA